MWIKSIGWEAAVRTADGKRYLKRIQRGATSGTFDLESHNAAPIRERANRMGRRNQRRGQIRSMAPEIGFYLR